MRGIVLIAALGFSGVISMAPALGAPEGERQTKAMRMIEEQVFSILTPEDRARVVEAGAFVPNQVGTEQQAMPATDAEYVVVQGVVSRQVFDTMRTGQRALLAELIVAQTNGQRAPAVCFAPGTDPAVVEAFERVRFPGMLARFQQGPRWEFTATNAGPLGQGDPCTITYSFVPDGTVVDSSDSSTSNLFARMNVIYPGGPAVWQALYDQIFARWSQLCAVHYVRELNDDGIALDAGPTFGQLGVRGDVRLTGSPIDGNSGILAFNYYPDSFDGIGGDMVVDTNDTFFDNTASNSLALRNVLAHEHGHGLGFPHVCPNLNTKLMEPFVSTLYDGPQLDDTLNAQRNYGDQFEPDETIGTAKLVAGASSTPQVLTPLSHDGTSDADFYKFPSVAAGSLLSVTVSPLGYRYAETFQDTGCIAHGTSLDPSRLRVLTLRVRNSGGVILTSTVGSLGAPLTLPYAASSTADLYVEVAADATDNIQAYSLTYSVTPGSPALGLYHAAPPATQVSTTASTGFGLQTTTSAALSANPTMFYRFSPSASYTAVVMSPAGAANAWIALMPASPCFASPQFYFSATSGANTQTLPAGAPGNTFRATVNRTRITVFTDSFETDKGWGYGQPGDTAITGIWQRGDPAASNAQPDAAASGINCAVTGIGTPGDGAGVHDVDSGFTRLLSPAFNIAAMRDVTLGYSRWYTNSGGAGPFADTFRVEISSDNGANWTLLETVGPTGAGSEGGWIAASFGVPAGVSSTSQMRLRFTAEDAAAGSLVEAALDDVAISGSATADFNGNGTISVQDLFDFLKAYFAASLTADFNKNGTVSPQDLFDFLKAYFAAC